MTNQKDNTSIEVRQTKRGLEFWAFNVQRRKMLHIGTLSGTVYEKAISVLWSPEPSIAIQQTEYYLARDHGAEFLRCVPGDKSATYAISFEDFAANMQPYYNNYYGAQWRTPLTAFQKISAVKKRNKHTDNPVKQVAEMLLPFERQNKLF